MIGSYARRLRRPILAGLAACAVILATASVLDRLYPPRMDRYLERSTMVADSAGGILRAFTTSDGIWRLPATVDDVAPLYIDMLLSYEDRRFRYHPGVDPLALARATAQWAGSGRVISGGSTLTMQVARLLEPRPRTMRSKLIEMLRAVQLELRYSKDELLAIYLTIAPYGGNIEGVRAASLAYFGREPSRLTPGEAALLVALPQSPSRTRPDRHAEAARAARDKVLRRVADAAILSQETAAEAMEQAVPDRRRDLPFLAPHLALELEASRPAGSIVATHIDRTLQAAAERLARDSLITLRDEANVAIMVVENRTRRVVAHVGSADFFDSARAGQVDLARAIRSPGSTLKPFIYGMGFEDLLIHPETIIADRPRRFGDYQPSNFDPVFSGEVTVREALIRSLNIPAVAVLDRLGPARLEARLRAAGMPLSLYDPDAPAGLPIALGGVGTSLDRLVALYAALADGGTARPLRYTDDAPEVEPTILMSPGAAWQTNAILAQVSPPDGRMNPHFARLGRDIAYKTGTSYGFRDAWAIGFDADHTIGVWVGRPDGTPSPDRYGRSTAAPILFRAFGLLPPPDGPLQPPAPDGVLLAANRDLPTRLRYFERPQIVDDAAIAFGTTGISIDFPLDGTTVHLIDEAGRMESLPLQADGGRRPLRWLVNGRPIHSPLLGRDAAWTPDGPGQATITVIDAGGQAASASIWVE